MAKMTYTEQLKHPNWQRIRLQRLEAADFECENCGDTETTLHVHHKQYFKGRMAWEYEFNELAVLCERCHQEEHIKDELTKTILANTHPHSSLLAGFNMHAGYLSDEDVRAAFNSDPIEFLTGLTACVVGHLNIYDIVKVAKFAASLTGEKSEARMIAEHNEYFKMMDH
jgi:hypothetical protein